jgi:hypothetical protein
MLLRGCDDSHLYAGAAYEPPALILRVYRAKMSLESAATYEKIFLCRPTILPSCSNRASRIFTYRDIGMGRRLAELQDNSAPEDALQA